MDTFYFTYGLEGHPFVGGWTKVVAPSLDIAIATFCSVHPNKGSTAINCGSIYGKNVFEQKAMFKEGNFGARCHERITVSVEKGTSDE